MSSTEALSRPQQTDRYPLLYDATLMRPGCVLLQCLGGVPHLAHRFDCRDWLVAPTPDMRCYLVTEDELCKLIAATKKHRNARTQRNQIKEPSWTSVN